MGKFHSSIKMDLSHLRKMKKVANKVKATEIEYGWINGKKYPRNDISVSRRGLTIATVAYMNEYGSYSVNNDGATIYIPSRPYFQQSLHMVKKHTETNILHVAYSIINGNLQNRYHFENVGERLKETILKSIDKQNYKELSTKTVNIKGHDYQWEDTGRMLDNITYKVTYKRATKAAPTTYNP